MATYIWTGLGDGVSYSDPNNWDADGNPAVTPPSSTDDVSVTDGSAVTIDATGDGVSHAQSLTIDNGSVDDGTTQVLTVDGAIKVGGTDALPSSLTIESPGVVNGDSLAIDNGTVDVNSGALNVTAGDLVVSDANGSAPADSHLIVENGGSVDVQAGSLVVSDGQVDVNGGAANSSVTVSGPLIVGKATNLITNGDFGAGDTGFTSDYVDYTGILPMPGPLTPGPYQIINASNIPNATGSGDWTTVVTDPFGGDGNVLVADGDETGTNRVWDQMVNVTPNASYAFSFYSVDLNTERFNDAVLAVIANGTQIGTVDTVGHWQFASFQWTAGAADTSVDLSLVDLNSNTDWNDFAID